MQLLQIHSAIQVALLITLLVLLVVVIYFTFKRYFNSNHQNDFNWYLWLAIADNVFAIWVLVSVLFNFSTANRVCAATVMSAGIIDLGTAVVALYDLKQNLPVAKKLLTDSELILKMFIILGLLMS